MKELGGYELDDLRIGLSATFAKTITETDIVLFAAVSGDNNALHINAEYAATTVFKSRIAHGMPCNHRGQEIIPARSRVVLGTDCTVNGIVVVTGEAMLLLAAAGRAVPGQRQAEAVVA